MKYLREIHTKDNGFIETYLQENKSTKEKDMYLKGYFATANTVNKNNRIYKRGILERELIKQQEKIANGVLLASVDHPENPEVNLTETAGIVTEADWESPSSNQILGKIKVLKETPKGSIIYNILNEVGNKKAGIGFSTRGTGSVKLNEQGVNEVQDDFNWVVTDIVFASSNGSDVSDLADGIIYENAEYYVENGIIKEDKMATFKNRLNKIYSNPKSRSVMEEKMSELFSDFISSI